jgi:hypothetical protein
LATLAKKANADAARIAAEGAAAALKGALIRTPSSDGGRHSLVGVSGIFICVLSFA